MLSWETFSATHGQRFNKEKEGVKKKNLPI